MSRLFALASAACLLTACTAYPMSRTFFEPMSDEGQLQNQPGCAFLHTRDTVQIRVGGINLSVLVGPERAPTERQPDLNVTLTFDAPTANWDLNTDKVVIVPGRSGKVLRRDLATDSMVAKATRWTLHYPEPAGLEDRIEVRFEAGALVVGGVAVEPEPLHFRRVKKSDVLFGSFNCVE